jgi:hypothetical protein
MHILCVLLLVWDSELATHPYSSDMDTHELAANSTASLRCFLQHPTNQFALVGKEQVIVSIGHLHLLQNSHRKV